eukprot:TRINITY_DN7242_c0_g1_i3.p1 TRINITY_DN7242_c0_g1~~TRINITY_DN7242_c0_g1_i3.p1  ORF type:complete len:379 (+),score=76.04 TRINITY_DN7242_c0_g1_i3:146-1138(+)
MGVCKTVEYRVSSIKNVGLDEVTLLYVLEKTRDVSELVRCAAYGKLVDEKVRLKALEMEQRYEVLLNGLMDYKQVVRTACGRYLKANMDWIVEDINEELRCKERKRYRNYKSDAAEVMEGIAEKGRSKTFTRMEKAELLTKLFDVKQLKNSNEYCICLKKLGEFLVFDCDSKELTLYFKERVIANLISNKSINEEGIVLMRIALDLDHAEKSKLQLDPEAILPESSILTEIVKNLIADNNVFVLHELLLLFTHYNHTEPTINQALSKALDCILHDISLEGLPTPSTSSQAEDLEQEYQDLVHDQLDLHRRDIVVRTVSYTHLTLPTICSV